MERPVIGIEIGGTKLQAALGSREGKVLALERGAVAPGETAEHILGWFDQAVPGLLKQAENQGAPASGIGVGFGGPIETATGRVVTSHQVKGWDGVRLGEWFSKRFGLPAAVLNDSNAAGWAEYRLGAGRGTRQFFYMNIGTGIGGALIVNERLHDGQGWGAGEIGHSYVPDFGASEPGRPARLEDLCAGPAIERRARALGSLREGSLLHELCGGDAGRITGQMIGEAAGEGDAAALDLLDRTTALLAVAVANVLALFHPERIAVGGGISLMGKVLFDPLRRHVEELAFSPYRGRYEIVPCALGEQVVIQGALLLAGREPV